jgi:hypothetical protein
MSDKMRWRYGDTNPVLAAVDAETVIEIGDLLYQDVDDAKPASALPDTGSPALNQQQFTARFLGVALQRSRVGDAHSIRVATTGVFEFDCPLGMFELGDPMAIDENAAGIGLLDHQVTPARRWLAIGRVAKREPLATTSVLVDVRSTVMRGGVRVGPP